MVKKSTDEKIENEEVKVPEPKKTKEEVIQEAIKEGIERNELEREETERLIDKRAKEKAKEIEKKKSEKPMSTFNFFFTIILLVLPIIGFIFSLVWAFTPKINKNRRNLASAFLLYYIIGILLIVWTTIFIGPVIRQGFEQFSMEFSTELKQIEDALNKISHKQDADWELPDNVNSIPQTSDPTMVQPINPDIIHEQAVPVPEVEVVV